MNRAILLPLYNNPQSSQQAWRGLMRNRNRSSAAALMWGVAGAVSALSLSAVGTLGVAYSQGEGRLPIYDDESLSSSDSSVVEYEYYEEEITPLRQMVTISRKTLCNAMTKLNQKTKEVREFCQVVQDNTKRAIGYLPTQEELFPGAGIVLVSTLWGSILAHSRNHGVVRRLLYPALFGCSSAYLVYPRFAELVSTHSNAAVSSIDWKQKAVQLRYFVVPGPREHSNNSNTGETAAVAVVGEEKQEKSSSSFSSMVKQEKSSNEEAVSDSSSSGKTKVEVVQADASDESSEDFGQSRKEDKSMYATRGKNRP
eukprot:Nk52_evm9s675 gene=Nk52_evmTU9s675